MSGKNLLIILLIIAFSVVTITMLMFSQYLQFRNFFGNRMFNSKLWIPPVNEKLIGMSYSKTYEGVVEEYSFLKEENLINIKLRDSQSNELVNLNLPNRYSLEYFNSVGEDGQYNIEPIDNIVPRLEFKNTKLLLRLTSIWKDGKIEKYISNITFLR